MDKKTAILNCAKQLFLEQGYKSTSIQSIADKAGISKGAVYLYFNAKDDILLAIFRMLEEIVWAKIETINLDESLSAREKYRCQIITFYDDIKENLQFSQIMLSESGVQLNEAFYSYAREYRFKLQIAQEKSLQQIYGTEITPWLSDLVVSINGIMQEFDASIVLDNLKLESEQLAEFICNMTEYLANGFLNNNPTPMFTDDTRKVREEFLAQITDQKHQEIINSFNQLAEEFHKLSVNQTEKETLDETLALLQDAIVAKDVNKTLVKALIANLKPFKQLKKPITQLLGQLDID